MDEPDKAFVVVALDLLSGLVQGLGSGIGQLLNSSNPPLLSLLVYCLKYPQAPVRQSAYALVGDMAVTCFDLLKPYLPQIIPEAISQLAAEPLYDYVSATNNAAWSIGEIALRYGPEFQQWVEPLIQRLVPILMNPKSQRSLHENAAVTIGRIGLVQPDMVAPHLEIFAQNWCTALWDIKDNEEKDSAFRGFCTMVERNPAGIAKSFLWLCNAIARWNSPSQELNDMFRKILLGFKEMSGAQWQVQVAAYPPIIQEKLRERYGV